MAETLGPTQKSIHDGVEQREVPVRHLPWADEPVLTTAAGEGAFSCPSCASLVVDSERRKHEQKSHPAKLVHDLCPPDCRIPRRHGHPIEYVHE